MRVMCSLAAYLAQSGLTQAAFAAKLGVGQAMISKLCRGVALPSLELAVEIQRETNGAVPVEMWIRGAA